MSEQQLPDAPQWIYDNIAEVSKMAKKVFTLYLSLILYTIITLATLTDRQILLNGTVRLPFIAVDVSLLGFLVFAPASILIVYVYFHLYLGRLNGLISQLRENYPSVPRRRLYPWIFNLATDPDPGIYGWGQRFIVAFSQIALIFVAFIMFVLPTNKVHSSIITLYIVSLLLLTVLYFLTTIAHICSTIIRSILDKDSSAPSRAAVFPPELFAYILATTIMVIMIFSSDLTSRSAFHTIPLFNRYFDLSYQRLVAPPELEFQGSFWLYLEDARLSEAKMEYTDIRRTYLPNADLNGADARHSNFAGSYLRGARLDSAFFDAAILDSTVFDSTSMTACVFSNTRFRWAKLDSCVASGSDFRHADLSEGKFVGAMLDSCQFDSANLLSCNFRNADLSFANLQGANVDNVNFNGAKLYRTNLTGVTNLSYGELEKAATLYEAILDDICREHVLRNRPGLLCPQTDSAAAGQH